MAKRKTELAIRAHTEIQRFEVWADTGILEKLGHVEGVIEVAPVFLGSYTKFVTFAVDPRYDRDDVFREIETLAKDRCEEGFLSPPPRLVVADNIHIMGKL